MREKLLISKSAKAEINIRDGSYFLEIFRKVGEIEKDGKKLPIFYDRNSKRKDSVVAKLNDTELAVIKKGIEIYTMYGYEKFKNFAGKVMKGYSNLLFPHTGGKLVGLEASEESISFTISKAGKDNNRVKYSVGTSSVAEMLGILDKLDKLAIINMMMKQKGLLLGAEQDNLKAFKEDLKEDTGGEYEETYEEEDTFEFEEEEKLSRKPPKP